MDNLQLISGIDIPFVEANLVIHQPTIREISFIGEQNFFFGLELLNFSKKSFVEKDRDGLEKQSDFNIIMAVINSKNEESLIHKNNLLMVLSLLFPLYSIKITPRSIIFIEQEKNDNKSIRVIDENNFNIFKDYVNKIFCLDKSLKEKQFNTKGKLSKKIAEKLQEGRDKIAKLKGKKEGEKSSSLYGRYLSILSIGSAIDINTLINYTVYQLIDNFDRFNLKIQNDSYFAAKVAGASGLDEVEDWRKELHD